MVVAAVMDSKPELPAIFGEIDEIYKRIIKYELAIDAVRNVVGKGALSKEDEEHIMLVLNPSNISKREMDAIGLTDQNLKNFRLPDRNIPALKGLVEKELNETFDLLQKLENATNSINNRDLDIASQAAELQKVSTATKDNVHKLYKHLKILLGLHTTNRTSCVKNSWKRSP
uniref:Actin cytoskeleton-regulatory complex protein pan1 n=1 Tax=Lygus hesperus TaxID=30085 RepID=A0A0A9WA65_LYGHE